MDGNISLHKAHETATGIAHRLKEKFGEDTHVGLSLIHIYTVWGMLKIKMKPYLYRTGMVSVREFYD